MEYIERLLLFTQADSIGSVALRGIIWVSIVLIVAMGIDRGKKAKHIKVDLGWFFLIITTLAIFSLIVFGIFPTF